MSKKSSEGGRRPAQMDKKLLANLRWKKVYGTWKEGPATWEEYMNIVRVCRDATSKAKVHATKGGNLLQINALGI